MAIARLNVTYGRAGSPCAVAHARATAVSNSTPAPSQQHVPLEVGQAEGGGDAVEGRRCGHPGPQLVPEPDRGIGFVASHLAPYDVERRSEELVIGLHPLGGGLRGGHGIVTRGWSKRPSAPTSTTLSAPSTWTRTR